MRLGHSAAGEGEVGADDSEVQETHTIIDEVRVVWPNMDGDEVINGEVGVMIKSQGGRHEAWEVRTAMPRLG
jgi:hypothetical protein